MLHALTLRAGVVVAVTFHEVDRAPNAKAGAKRNHKCLKYVNSRIEEIHYQYLQIQIKNAALSGGLWFIDGAQVIYLVALVSLRAEPR